ncbi:hypothetical protein L218DRAFT_951058 [Marasmius fiardii PR-910]|nr:hypothetical protein L218DRAFT_951058 [Marasmius fiardii PR-910]
MELNANDTDSQIQVVGSGSGSQPHPTQVAQLDVDKRLDSQRKVIQIKSSDTRKVKCLGEAPIRKLPREVLRLIFEQAVDKNVIIGRRGTSKFSAVTLSSVCSHWREVVLDNRKLWATISVYFHSDPLPMDAYERAKEYLEMAIQRAGSVGLSVTIEFHSFPRDDIGEWGRALQSLYRILTSAPWKSATIRHIGWVGLSSIEVTGLLQHFQTVERLEVEVADYSRTEVVVYESHPFFHPDSPLQNFPNLKVLLLPHENPHFSKIPPNFYQHLFHSLTVLRICAGDDWRGTLEAMRRCRRSLVSLTVNVFPSPRNPQRPPPAEGMIVRFPALRELIVVVTPRRKPARYLGEYDHPLNCAQKVLELMECPELFSLTLRSNVRGSKEYYAFGLRWRQEVKAFTDFIERSRLSMSLQTFELRGFWIWDEVALFMLEALPGIRGLMVGGSDCDLVESGQVSYSYGWVFRVV